MPYLRSEGQRCSELRDSGVLWAERGPVPSVERGTARAGELPGQEGGSLEAGLAGHPRGHCRPRSGQCWRPQGWGVAMDTAWPGRGLSVGRTCAPCTERGGAGSGRVSGQRRAVVASLWHPRKHGRFCGTRCKQEPRAWDIPGCAKQGLWASPGGTAPCEDTWSSLLDHGDQEGPCRRTLPTSPGEAAGRVPGGGRGFWGQGVDRRRPSRSDLSPLSWV